MTNGTALLIIYCISVAALLISIYSLLTFEEAREAGERWAKYTRALEEKIEELLRKRR